MNSADSPSPASELRGETHKSGPTLTDAAVICSFMEPIAKFPRITHGGRKQTPLGWWLLKWHHDTGGKWEPKPLALDALWEVEERLSDEQWAMYLAALADTGDVFRISVLKAGIHATAEQKIRALAAALRICAANSKDESPEGLSGDSR